MRPRILVIALALGLAAYVVARLARRRARRNALDAEAARAEQFARRGGFASDPGDPVQLEGEAEELAGTPLDVDAQSSADAEAAQDLVGLEAALESEPDVVDVVIEMGSESRGDPGAEPSDVVIIEEAEPGTVDAVIELEEDEIEERHARGDDGDLYGAHTPPAADRTHPDNDRSFDEGQNWLEALETSAAESGAEPERELDDIVDDEDVLRPPHPAASRDTPVADHGAGGRRGL
jgi:hypothetical protein